MIIKGRMEGKVKGWKGWGERKGWENGERGLGLVWFIEYWAWEVLHLFFKFTR